jgi:GDPmannose 4,6-dehydratase
VKRALITGITGQDGSYLADLLLAKGYEVHGLVRRASTSDAPRLAGALRARPERLRLHVGDLADGARLLRLVDAIAPDEVYHLGAQSAVGLSFEVAEATLDVTGLGTVRLLEAVRHASGRDARVLIAASSEMFGRAASSPQDETTPVAPCSPYGIAKAASYWAGVAWRDGYGMRIRHTIGFNHESPRRSVDAVTRKVARAVARIRAGLDDHVALGNLDAGRDFGYAPEYVEAMWRIVQHDADDDFVLATGETHTVRDWCERAFARAGLDWTRHVRVDARHQRPLESGTQCGDASKIRRVLGWAPQVRFGALVDLMVDAERVDATADAP